jgi:hypothetical protein
MRIGKISSGDAFSQSAGSTIVLTYPFPLRTHPGPLLEGEEIAAKELARG